MTALAWEVLQLALRSAQRWLRRADVLAVGIGQRHEHGRWQQDRPCIVVKVAWKLAEDQLRSTRRWPVPRWIAVDIRGRRRRVRVDVQETRGQTTGCLHGLVGSGVGLNHQTIGSVSAIVQTPDGARLALISGHVGRTAGRTLSIGGVAGKTRAPVFTSRMDHCLVDIPALPGGAERLDDHALAGTAPVASLDVDRVLYFNRAATGQRVPVVLRHLVMSASFDYPWGARELKGMLVTEGLTVTGDSGTLLYDNAFRAIGTLVGSFGGESYFIPCETALPTLGVRLC